MILKTLFAKVGMVLLTLLLLGGCGSNNSQTVPVNKDSSVVSSGDTTASFLFVSDVTVSQDDESVTIRVQALTKNGSAATDGNVSYQVTDDDVGQYDNGALTPATAEIEDGYATFTYSAPSNLQNQIDAGNLGTSYLFYVKDSTDITVPISITFDTSAVTTNDPISSLLLDPSSLTITEAGSYTVNATGLNSAGKAVANGGVYVKWPDTGSVNPGKMTSSFTITAGEGSFSYTTPSDLTTLSTISPLTFELYDSATSNLLTTFKINFSGSSITPHLTISPTSATITKGSDEATIAVVATDNNGKALSGVTIEVLNPVGASAGTFNASEVDTDGSGKATFTYTAPSTIAAGTATFTFRYKDNTAYRAYWSAVFSPAAGESTDPITTLVTDNNVTATTDGESISITVSAFTASGAYAQTGSISVRPQNQLANIGSFTATQVDIGENGRATFEFIAPDPIDDSLADQVFIFTSSSGATTQTTVSYESQPISGEIYPERINVNVNGVYTNDVNITQNGEVKTVLIRVWGNDDQPYDGGNIKIKFPTEAIQGTADVGYFAESTVACENGRAEFTYNAPSNLSGRDGDAFTFSFVHDSTDSQAGEADLTFTLHPDLDQIVITTYELRLVAADAKNTMGLEEQKAFTVKVVDTDDNITEISEGNYTITLLNTDMADIVDSDGTHSEVLTKNDAQNVIFRLETSRISGLLPLKVSVTFVDVNGDTQTIEEIFNVLVFSGPPTTIGIDFTPTVDFDSVYAEFTEHFVVTVTDEYENLVNTNPTISVGAIVGYATTDLGNPYNPDNYIYFQPDGATTGTITNAADQFTASNAILGNVDQSGNDKLAIIPPDYDFNAGGKWDFDYVSNSVLNLIDDYDGTDLSGLGFAIGHNHRVRTCEVGAKENARVYIDGNNTIDDYGRALVTMAYQPYMVGKDVILWVNILTYKNEDDSTQRSGTGRKFTLRGSGLASDSFTVPKNDAGTITFFIGQNDSGQPYLNGHFLANAESTGDVVMGTKTYSNITDCSYSGTDPIYVPGQAYISIPYVSGSEGGTITIAPVVRPEIQ